MACEFWRSSSDYHLTSHSFYRTWEILAVFHRDRSRVRKFLNMVNQIQTVCALTGKPEPVPDIEDMVDIKVTTHNLLSLLLTSPDL